MATMPFSPCADTGDCTDATVSILQRIFGDVVTQLATGGDPGSVGAATNVLASMFQVFNSGILLVGAMILGYVTIIGVINTANDGEAMGKQWSSIWTPLRMVAGGASLLPTAAGYSFIQIIVLMTALWGIGFANTLFNTGITMGIMGQSMSSLSKTAGVGSPSVAGHPSFDIRADAEKYLKLEYCAKILSTLYPGAQVAPVADEAATVLSANESQQTYRYVDTGPTGLAGTAPVCGQYSHIEFVVRDRQAIEDSYGMVATAISSEAWREEQADKVETIENLTYQIADAKKRAYVLMETGIQKLVYGDGTAQYPGLPVSPSPETAVAEWGKVDSATFNTVVQEAQNAFFTEVYTRNTVTNNELNNILDDITDGVTDSGWSMAGGWYQRIGGIRSEFAKAFNQRVFDAATPDAQFSVLPDGEAKTAAVTHMEMIGVLLQKASQKPGAQTLPVGTVLFKDDGSVTAALADTSNLSVDSFNSSGNKIAAATTGRIQSAIVGTLMGTDSDVDSITRLKSVGDTLYAASIAMSAVKALVEGVGQGVSATVAVLSIPKVVGNGADFGPLISVIMWMVKGIAENLMWAIQWLDYGAFYFGTFLPALPYTIFIIGVVGWLMQVLQSMLAAPLWMVMHMRPNQSFIGSDHQGYLLMLTLFARPPLMIIGLFAGILVADPVIEFVTMMFFSMQSGIVQSGSLSVISWVSEFARFKDWLMLYGFVLLPVLTMIFGLAATMPDVVLKWIGAGISSMGESSAASSMQSGLSAYGKGKYGAVLSNNSGGGSRARLESQKTEDKQQELNSGRSSVGGREGGGSAGGGRAVSGGRTRGSVINNPGQGVVDASAEAAPATGGSSRSRASIAQRLGAAKAGYTNARNSGANIASAARSGAELSGEVKKEGVEATARRMQAERDAAASVIETDGVIDGTSDETDTSPETVQADAPRAVVDPGRNEGGDQTAINTSRPPKLSG